MMNESPLLLADLEGIIQVVVIVLVIIGALVGQWKAAMQAKQAPRRPIVPPGGQGNQGDRPALNKAVLDRELGQEINKFLGRRTPQPHGTVVVSDWSDGDVDEFEPDIIDAEALPAAGVASHVEHHLDAREFNQRTARLGDRIGQSDEKLESRLHKTFDHKLGSLSDSSSAGPEFVVAEGTDAAIWGTADAGPSAHAAIPDVTAQTIADVLRRPEQIRQAVLLAEILDRPTKRWL